MESLVHVDSFFGTGLKIRDAVLALTPCLGSLCSNLLETKGFVQQTSDLNEINIVEHCIHVVLVSQSDAYNKISHGSSV